MIYLKERLHFILHTYKKGYILFYIFSTIFSRIERSLSSLSSSFLILSSVLSASLSKNSSTGSFLCLFDGPASTLSLLSCCSGFLGTEPRELTAGTMESSSDEAMRMGGWMDGLPPIASSMRSNHFHVPAVDSPDSVPIPVGGFLSS